MQKVWSVKKYDKEKINELVMKYNISEMLAKLILAIEIEDVDIDDVLANVPMGLEITARMSTNYLQLKTIYNQRKNHRKKQGSLWRAEHFIAKGSDY